MPGSHCLLKWTVSRSCFSCRQGPEHYCTISAWVEELVEGCGDSSGDWDEDLIVMNMEIWIHLHDEPIYRYAAQPFYKELLALQGMKVSRCFLKAGQNLLLMSEIHFSAVFQGGISMVWEWMVFVCLLAYFFSSPFDDNLSGEFGLPSWVFAQIFLSIMALIASYE